MQYDIGPNHCKGWPSQSRALVPPVSKPTLFFHQLSPERFVDTRDRSLSICLGVRGLRVGVGVGVGFVIVHLIVPCSCGKAGWPWGHIIRGACALTTTQHSDRSDQPRKREDEEPRWRRWTPTMVVLMMTTIDDSRERYAETLHGFSVAAVIIPHGRDPFPLAGVKLHSSRGHLKKLACRRLPHASGCRRLDYCVDHPPMAATGDVEVRVLVGSPMTRLSIIISPGLSFGA